MHLTERDCEIIKLVHRHRFLRSEQIVALIASSPQQVLRRLKLLYHHGYLERPRAQLEYFEKGGSQPMVYGLSSKGGKLLRQEHGSDISWSEGDGAVGKYSLITRYWFPT